MRYILNGFIILFLLVLVGCPLSKNTSRNTRLKGEYTEFKKLNETTRIYLHPKLRVVEYKIFQFNPVSIYENPARRIKRSIRKELNDYKRIFQLRAKGIFQEKYKVVDESGPGVLEMKITVVDIKPFVELTREDGTRYVKTDTTLGGTKFEVDCIDTQTGERIASMVTLYSGEEYLAFKDVTLLVNVEQAFDEWVFLLRNMLDNAKYYEKKTRQ